VTREQLFDATAAIAQRIHTAAPALRALGDDDEDDAMFVLRLILMGLDGPDADDLYDACDTMIGKGEVVEDPDEEADETERYRRVGACISGALMMLAATRALKPSESVTEGPE
jgi:hypothetical protein